MNPSFGDYLRSKNIDPIGFAASEPELFGRFEHHFCQMHPESFTMQKKFFLNDLRRRYLLQDHNKQITGQPAEPAPLLPASDSYNMPQNTL
jgi:hypothetical protein